MDWIKCIASRLLRAGRRQAGVTLVETVVAIALFGVVSTSLIGVLTSAASADALARQRSIALELAQQSVEYIRQLNYSDAGIQDGNPPGLVPATQEKNVDGLWYTLTTRIKYVNDPVPTSFATFANYKQVRIIVTRATDGKELTRVTTYLSSSTRSAAGGLNNGVINVSAQDYWTHNLLGGAEVTLSKTWDASFTASDTTDSVPGSPTFGQVTFAALEATPVDPTGYYEVLASLYGYTTLSEDLPPNDPANLQLAPSGTTSTTVRLYKPSSLTVRIIDGANPPALYTGPATVTISSQSRGVSQDFTTTTGSVAITANDTLGVCPACEPIVPGSDYAISVDADVTGGHRHGDLTGQTVPADYSVANPSSSLDVTLATTVIPDHATLTVVVRHTTSSHMACSSGSVISGAAVSISEPSLPYTNSGNTNSSGTIVFSNTPLGTYNINASTQVVIYHHTYTYYGGLSAQPLTQDTTFCVPILY
ncbi:MAG: prepilin-type N-terminal cleavage/methylation domain-containing protein [Gaiellaceae bacterium]